MCPFLMWGTMQRESLQGDADVLFPLLVVVALLSRWLAFDRVECRYAFFVPPLYRGDAV